MENHHNNRHDRHNDEEDDDEDNDDDNNNDRGEDNNENNDDDINNNDNINIDNNNDAAVEPLALQQHADVNHNIDGNMLRTASTCGKEPLTGLQVIPISSCLLQDYLLDPKAPERKGVVAVMLSLRTATGGSKATTLVNTGGARYVSGSGANSRFRLPNNVTSANYERIVTFADCSSTNGACFAFMTHTKTQSVALFENMRVGQEGIGDLILLEEIYPVDDTLGTTTNVALVKRCSHVLPLSGDMATLVPSVPLEAAGKGDTRYFCQHHVRTIKFGHVTIEQAVCGGKLWYAVKWTRNHCFAEWSRSLTFPVLFFFRFHLFLDSDRQLLFEGTGQSCGCFYKTDRHNPLVIEMTVTFHVPLKFDALGIQSVVAFRSLRTSKLFVAPDCWNLLDCQKQQHEDALRVAVDRINDYISRRGGWTYIGWMRTGATTDQSDMPFKDVENIASLNQTPHISYLIPTDRCNIADNNMVFQRLRLHASELE